jgi:hypothetical protein
MEPASAQIPSNVLLRVKKIEVGPNSGTAFTIEVDRRQYIVTAKHVVATLKGTDETVTLCETSMKCQPTQVTVLRCDDPIDIAVLVPKTQQTVTYPLEPALADTFLGQDMFFLGFPYGDNSLVTTFSSITVAFIRKATFSAQQCKGNATLLYLDGRNNVGFSGGPIVYQDLNQSGSVFKVAGVVSGFRPEIGDVFKPELIEESNIVPEDRAKGLIIDTVDGRHFKLNRTGNVVSLNSDIVVGYAIDHAVDLIRKSQTKGPVVSP